MKGELQKEIADFKKDEAQKIKQLDKEIADQYLKLAEKEKALKLKEQAIKKIEDQH